MSTLKVNTINAATTGQPVAVDVKNPKTFRNLIINGDQSIAQRGTSSTTDAAFVMDRWKVSSSGLGVTVTNSQQTLSSSDTPYDYGFRNYNRLALASAGTTGAGNYIQFWYTVEAQDLAKSGWDYTSSSSYITISFWARASSSQTYGCVFETNDGTAYLYPKSFALTANTWEKHSFKVPGNSNLTVNNDNGAGLVIKIYPYLGTNYSGGTDATWAAASGNGYGSMGNASTWVSAGASTFDLTGIQLEVGSYATDFEHRSYAEELARCQRYYQLNKYCSGKSNGNGQECAFFVPAAPTMRTTPSVALINGTNALDEMYVGARSISNLGTFYGNDGNGIGVSGNTSAGANAVMGMIGGKVALIAEL